MNDRPRVCVSGAGGFVGTHLVRYLKEHGYWVRGVDLKWPQWSESEADEFVVRDLRHWADAMDAMHGIDWAFCLAADMGGMGFITTHDAEIIKNNTLININSIEAARLKGVSRYLFSSSACIYPVGLQDDDARPLAECDAYPADPQHCLVPDTEVMTRDGFKFISDISLDDEIATLSDEGYLEFHKPTQLQVMEYSGQMIHFKGRYFDCIVTPNHSVYASLKKESKPIRITAKDFVSRKRNAKGYFRRNCKWRGCQNHPGTVKIPSVPFERNHDKAYRGERKKKGFTVHLDDYLCFMGWYITEGCCILHSSKGYEVHIRQCDETNLASIKSLLDGMKITYYDPGDGRVVIDSKPLWTHLQDCGQEAAQKRLPLWILDLPSDRLEILFRAMMLGDGTYETRRGNGDIPKTYFTSSPFLRDQFVEICLKLGYACAISTQPAHGNIKTRYMIYISTQKFKHKVRDENIERVAYSGLVYDMTVPNHVFYIRHNGKHVWTGNSYGWEKLHAEHLCRYYREAGWLDTRIVRFHNCYGPEGSWNDGREKAPAALCRKVAEAELSGDPEVEIWGDGGQVRSYMYVADCVEGLLRVMEGDHPGPLNIGRDREITVDGLADLIAGIAGIDIVKVHVPGPEGVRRRNSDNTLCRQVLNWAPSTPLEEGLVPTYEWVRQQVLAEGGDLLRK